MIGEESVFSDAGIFAHEQQERAVSELLCGIESDPPRRIAYLQTGRRTMRELLERRFPGAEISPLNLSRPDGPTPRFARNEVDLIYCNGDLELLPLLPGLLPKLADRLRFGGRLAAHFPDNLYEPNRVLARMVAADGPWAKQLLPIAKTRPFGQTMEELYARLRSVYALVDIWETVHLCVMSGVGVIVDFMKTTSLAPYLAPLDETLRKAFLNRFVSELTQAYPPQPDGAVLLRLPRICVLTRR